MLSFCFQIKPPYYVIVERYSTKMWNFHATTIKILIYLPETVEIKSINFTFERLDFHSPPC